MRSWEERYNHQLNQLRSLAAILTQNPASLAVGALTPILQAHHTKILYYVRLNGILTFALQYTKEGNTTKAANYLSLAKAQCETAPAGEESHAKLIRSLIKEASTRLSKPKSRSNARTKLQIAQNVCILRLLKV